MNGDEIQHTKTWDAEGGPLQDMASLNNKLRPDHHMAYLKTLQLHENQCMLGLAEHLNISTPNQHYKQDLEVGSAQERGKGSTCDTKRYYP